MEKADRFIAMNDGNCIWQVYAVLDGEYIPFGWGLNEDNAKFIAEACNSQNENTIEEKGN